MPFYLLPFLSLFISFFENCAHWAHFSSVIIQLVIMAEFGVRMAVPHDAEVICSLIRELADCESTAKGWPRLEPDQLGEDLAVGVVRALVAFTSHNELVGHAVFFFSTSLADGKSLCLDNLFIRSQYRRKGIGRRIMSELSKMSEANNCAQLVWNMHPSSTAALAFSKRIGAVGETRSQWWQMERKELWKVIAYVKQRLSNQPLSFAVLMDGEIMDDEQANAWASVCLSTFAGAGGGGHVGHRERDHCLLLRLFSAASLGAIVARRSDDDEVLGAALFHRMAYSSWTGRFMVVDQLVVRPEYRRKGIGTAIVAELAMIALRKGCHRIGFAPQQKNNGADPFLRALKCVNVTAKEGLLTFRWKG